MSFILDTGSAWMWMPSAKCPQEECTGERFNATMSESFQDMNQTKKMKYGNGYLEGDICQDQVTLTESPPDESRIPKNVDFLSVYHAQNLSNIVSDGLVGLAPAVPPGAPAPDLFINELYNKASIGLNMFSMYLGDVHKQ